MRDPVCGMDVDEANATKVEHDGQTYYFCNDECAQKFKQSPDRYTQGKGGQRQQGQQQGGQQRQGGMQGGQQQGGQQQGQQGQRQQGQRPGQQQGGGRAVGS